MLGTKEHPLGHILDRTAQALDITPELYERVERAHEEVGEWLGGIDSPLRPYDLTVYPHGSFRLGTVIRPLTDEDYCDIDTVCRLEVAKEGVTRHDLKKMVGDRLKQSPKYKRIVEECRTCWTLRFDRHFRMDVLPAIPNPEYPPDGILITDKEGTRWLHSNPIAFAEWFKYRMRVEQQRLILASRANVEQIPEWQLKTSLQRAVQLLKRHRDIRFEIEDQELKPLSILITTLAAHAYDNQADLFEAMDKIAHTMRDHIEQNCGEYFVENPANPGENFASSWNEEPRKADAFFEWLDVLESDLDAASKQNGLHRVKHVIENSYGRGATERAYEIIGKETLQQRTDGKVGVKPVSGLLTLGTGIQIQPHRNFGDATN